MKYIRIFVLFLFMMPGAVRAASDFTAAAQLLAAAKNADIQQVQALINAGADVNFVDNTGLSVVCTALMNNDTRAAQILQMYGADASKCDRQIKQYKSRSPGTKSGGLFSGLSSAQSIALAAAGAAVVVGGLFLLTDLFDPGNDNKNNDSNGTRPGGDGGSSGTGGYTQWTAGALPYGPAMVTTNQAGAVVYNTNYNYSEALDYFKSNGASIYADNFELMNQNGNYLLMMHGYSPMARGYMGAKTLRNAAHTPFINGVKGVQWWTRDVIGGAPVNVMLVTKNGVNAATGTSIADDEESLMPWLGMTGTTPGGAGLNSVSAPFYNDFLDTTNAQQWSDIVITEQAGFDLSGFGTAIHNPLATASDNLLAKIVGGRDSGYADADFVGFMPNGQMTIYRTGGGWGFTKNTSGTGSFTMAGGELGNGDTFVVGGITYTVQSVNGTRFTATSSAEDAPTAGGWVVGEILYLDTNNDGNIDMVFTMNTDGNTLAQTLQGGAIDYKNYRALLNALSLRSVNGQIAPSVLANTSVIKPLRGIGGEHIATITDILSFATSSSSSQNPRLQAFYDYIDQYYDNNTTDGDTGSTNALPHVDAYNFFNAIGTTGGTPLVLFSTGGAWTSACAVGDSDCVGSFDGAAQDATFENAAPLLFSGLKHLFMSIVAVNLRGGTADASSISGYNPGSKYALAEWGEYDATGENINYYRARKCGVAGRGSGSIDPWCFAAAGINDEQATAAAAGAAGALIGAFDYMTSDQIFTLMALTADGAYLATNPDTGQAWANTDELIAYLQNMYELPDEAMFERPSYLDAFKDVFGYGLINLERATTPGSMIYYYDGNTDSIVSVSGSNNSYWRAASATTFRTSSAFNPAGVTISAPVFDILTSADGEMTLPRIWKNEFSLGVADARGLYMGDVLGEFKTRNVTTPRVQIGNIGLSVATSNRDYNDYMSGLDFMNMDYAAGNWSFAAGYQRYFTDGMSRFDGTANPILSLASNVVSSDVEYNVGRWSFGARAFSGAITDEGLLENDPTVGARYMPGRLGLMRGAGAGVAWHGDKFEFTASVGSANETDTLLGAQTGGLLDLGNGDTMYVDALARYNVMPDVALSFRSTFAHTTSDASGQFILGLSDIDSNAFSVSLDAGNFSLAVAQPLAVYRGSLAYSHAEYDIITDEDGRYQLDIVDARRATLALRPEHRETRITASYRHRFGEYTDGALGFIYRMHPNHTDAFGNESIFMLKMSHRLGI